MTPTQVSTWKKQATEGLADVFAGKTAAATSEAEIKELHAKIGRLAVENDFCHEGSNSEPRRKRARVERYQPTLSLSAQCRILQIGRSTLYYRPLPASAEELAVIKATEVLGLCGPGPALKSSGYFDLPSMAQA